MWSIQFAHTRRNFRCVAKCAGFHPLVGSTARTSGAVRPFTQGAKLMREESRSRCAYSLSEVSTFFWWADSGYFSLNASARS